MLEIVMNATALHTDSIPQSGRISTTLERLSTTPLTTALAQSLRSGTADTRIVLLGIIGSLFCVALMGVFAILCLQCHKTQRVGLKIGRPKGPAIEVGALSPPSGSRTTMTSTQSAQNSQDTHDSAFEFSPTMPGSPSLEVRRHTDAHLSMELGSRDTQISSQNMNAPIECVSAAISYAPYASAKFEREHEETVRVNHNMLRNENVMTRVMARDILDELQFDEVFGAPSEGRCTVTEVEGVDESADTTFRHERPHIIDESTLRLEIVVMGDDEFEDVTTPQDPELTPEAAMQQSPRYAVV